MRIIHAFLIILTLLCGPTFAQQMLMASTPPVGQFVFAGPGPLDPRITFTRSSARTCWAATTFLVTLGKDQPCFDYYPGTSVPRGLLIEGSRTNLLLWNRDLTNAAWTKTNVTVVSATGIDGVAGSASRLTATANNGTVLQAVTSGSAARATTAYVRRVSGSGTVEMTQNGGTNWTTVVLTSGWTRVGPASATVTNPSVGFRLGTSGDAIEVDFVQLESGSFPTSAIFTTTAAATRAPDAAVVTNIQALGFNPVEGSFLVEFEVGAMANFPNVLRVDTDSSNFIEIYLSAGGSAAMKVVSGGSNQGEPAIGSYTTAGVNKLAFRYRFNDMRGYVNGSAGGGDNTVNLPAWGPGTQLVLGHNGLGGNQLNGHIRRLSYWPLGFSDGQLQALTQ